MPPETLAPAPEPDSSIEPDSSVEPRVAIAQTAGAPIAPYTHSRRFNYSGSVQNFTVPPGVTTVNARCWGGGGYGIDTGGGGGFATGDITVVPGETLRIVVDLGGGVAGGGGMSGLFSQRLGQTPPPRPHPSSTSDTTPDPTPPPDHSRARAGPDPGLGFSPRRNGQTLAGRAGPRPGDTKGPSPLHEVTALRPAVSVLRGRGELHEGVAAAGRDVQQPVALRLIDGQAPAELVLGPLLAVPAQRIRRRRQPLGRILISLGPVGAGGDRDQGGELALVVGVRLPPLRRPRTRPSWRGASFEACGIHSVAAPVRAGRSLHPYHPRLRLPSPARGCCHGHRPR